MASGFRDGGVVSLSEVVGTTNDIFLSYSSADRDVVRNVARRLREAGVKVWFDKDSLSPGSGWQDELATQLMDSRACAVFVGPDEIVGWKRYEMEVALNRSVRDRDFHVFPVLLPGIEHFDASGCRRSWPPGSGSTCARARSPRRPSRTSSTRFGASRGRSRRRWTRPGVPVPRSGGVRGGARAVLLRSWGPGAAIGGEPAAGPVRRGYRPVGRRQVVAGPGRPTSANTGRRAAREQAVARSADRPGPLPMTTLSAKILALNRPRHGRPWTSTEPANGCSTRRSSWRLPTRPPAANWSSSSTSSKRPSPCATIRPSVGPSWRICTTQRRSRMARWSSSSRCGLTSIPGSPSSRRSRSSPSRITCSSRSWGTRSCATSSWSPHTRWG